MCGIAGVVGGTDDHTMVGMLDRIQHRGPDSYGYKCFSEVMLGNTRLSIIDPEGGDQPISNPSEDEWVVMNGELYGYRSIRDRFMDQGYPFKTRTDTEILLPLYDEYGLNLFDQLNGMFSFCLYLSREDEIILARDHVGIKPLVYTIYNQKLYFSSEVKSFFAIPDWQASPDMNGWHAFLNIRFPPGPQTLFKDVSKLPPGCYMRLSRIGRGGDIPKNHQILKTFTFGEWHASICRYYHLPTATTSLSIEEATHQGSVLLQQTMDDQMIADVPVGVYLSGGIDSSTVTSFASHNGHKSINTFCLGFNEPTDENKDAELIAQKFGTTHTDVILDENPLQHFSRAIYFMEEPKVNCLQGYLLAREAVKYQKVILSGLGGDELFGGYDIYEIGLYLDILRKKPLSTAGIVSGPLLKKLLSLNAGLSFDNTKRAADLLSALDNPLELYLLLRNGWDHDQRIVNLIYQESFPHKKLTPVRDQFSESFDQADSIAEMFMRFEFQNKMVDDFLTNEDRMSMAHSLEVRVPFLDKRIVEFGFSLPLEWKIKIKQRKILLKKILKNLVPDEILHKKKHGFTFNPVLQAQKDLQPLARKYLTEKRVKSSGVFNYEYLEKILYSRPRPQLRWHYFLLWKILGYHIWEDIFIRNQGNTTDISI